MPEKTFGVLLIAMLIVFSLLLIVLGLYLMSPVAFAENPSGWQQTGESPLEFHHVPADQSTVNALQPGVEQLWSTMVVLLDMPADSAAVVYLHPSVTHFQNVGFSADRRAGIGPEGAVHLVSIPTTRDELAQVLRAELTRLALNQRFGSGAGQLPSWLIAGMAEWGVKDETDTAWEGTDFFEYLLERCGRAQFADFLESATGGEGRFELACVRYLGKTPAGLREEWEARQKRLLSPDLRAVGFGLGVFVLLTVAARSEQRVANRFR